MSDTRDRVTELEHYASQLYAICHCNREHLNDKQLEVIRTSPTQSLKTYRNEVLEEAATLLDLVRLEVVKIVKDHDKGYVAKTVSECAGAIRELKSVVSQ